MTMLWTPRNQQKYENVNLAKYVAGAYILKAEKVAVMAILANKNWRKKCVNLDKTKIAKKVRESWK